MKLRWTKPAREDLVAIKAYISRDSVVNARRFIAQIKDSAAQLQAFPELGGRVEHPARDDLRELIVGNYRIIYVIRDRAVHVLTVLHGARRLPADFE